MAAITQTRTKEQLKESFMRRFNLTTEEDFERVLKIEKAKLAERERILQLTPEQLAQLPAEQTEQFTSEQTEQFTSEQRKALRQADTIVQFQRIVNENKLDKLTGIQRREFDNLVNTGQVDLPDFPGSRVLEPIRAIAGGLVNQSRAGIEGIVSGVAEQFTAPFTDSPARSLDVAVEQIRDVQTRAFQPKTKSGREGLKNVGEFVQTAIDVFNFPISGIGGLIELVTGQGLDQAVSTVESVQKKGVGETLGERVFEETGSPITATAGELLPELVGSKFAVKPRISSGKPRIDPAKAKDIDEILKAGKDRGVDVLTQDIFQPEGIFTRLTQQFAERIPVIGTGGKRAKQQAQRIKALEDLDLALPSVNSEAIFESLKKSASRRKRAAGNRLGDFVTKLDNGIIPVNNTVIKIDKAIARLTRTGKLQDKALLKDLKTLKTTVTDAGSNFGLLREFRTDTRNIADKVDIAGRSQLRSSDKAMMDNIVKGITQDLDVYVFQNLGKIELGRYKQADNIYRQEATTLTKSGIKNVLDKGDVKPELINNLLFSSAPSEINLLFKNLNTQGREHARVALYRRALDNAGKGGELSPVKFVSELNKLKTNFNVFFRDGGKAELEGLKRLLTVTKRASESSVVTATGQTLQIPLAAGVVAGAVTGVPGSLTTLLLAGTVGLGSSIFNSSGVRNMLIKLGKSKRTGSLELSLLKSIPIALQEAQKTIEQATAQQETNKE